MKLGILLLLICQSIAFATLGLEQVGEAEIDYWKWTSKNEISSWSVKATKEEVQSFKNLLVSAVPATDDEITFFTTSYKGSIKSDNGEYAIALGEEKTVRHTYRISLYPKGDPKGRKIMHYHLPEEAGRSFSLALEKFLKDKAQRKPDHVETRR